MHLKINGKDDEKMEKNYEIYATQVQGCNKLFTDEVKRIADECTKVMGDFRYSEQGKEEKKREHFAALNAIADNLSRVCKEAIRHFCDDFRVSLPEDGKDHSRDIENALKIIELLGVNLDVQNFQNIMNPLRGSFRSMKVIADLLEAKNKGGANYDSAIMKKLYEYMGGNGRVFDYLHIFEIIESIIGSTGDRYGFSVTSYGNASVIRIQERIPYDFLACADWMKQAGKEYAALEEEFSDVFKTHIPTDRELIESTLKSQ